MRSTGLVLAAGGIAAANEVIFAPLASGTGLDKSGNLSIASDFNWRLIPATAVLALILGGLETVAPKFAVGLAGLTLLAVLVSETGNASSPLANLDNALTKGRTK